jgi:signal transduction histidine kinase
LKLDKISVRWQICFGFASFAAVLLILLWLFQIVFLDSFYQSIKTKNIESCAQAIVQNIDNKGLPALVDDISTQNDVSVRILDLDIKNLFQDLFSVQASPDSAIHRMTYMELYDYANRAKEKGGTLLETNSSQWNREYFIQGQYGGIYGVAPPADRLKNDSLIYVSLVTRTDRSSVMVMLHSSISPVNSTVETLRIQLMIITGILVALALVLSILISRMVSKPIVKINETAQSLAKGRYDVTFEGEGYKEIKQLNDTLNYAATELSKVEGLRRDLIANISHDLRTPLTMITGYGEMMRDIPGENTPENVQVIIDEATRLSSLVTDLLDISKLQSGAQSLSLTEFDLTQSVRSILKRYSLLTSQDGYKVEFICDTDVFVRADEIKISQVVYNLINNAVNYAGEDKTVIVTQRVVPGRVRLEVTDHGKGIAQEELPYIWDRYYKVDKTHKRAVIGTGLGLSIVKSVLDMHGADYGVTSQEGVGSTFWFEIDTILLR